MRSFQKDIRKTLTQYALIPLAVIALLGTLLGFWGWQHDVAQRSEETRLLAAEVLDKLLEDYTERIEFVAQNDAFLDVGDGEQRRALYEWLYHEVNISHDSTRFYLLDTQGNILLSNYHALPEYLQGISMHWGIWKRLQNAPSAALLEFSPRMTNQNSDLLVGRAIVREGEIKGYWLFVISGDYIANAVQSLYMDFALVNDFDYASVATNPMLRDRQFQTLPKAFYGKNHEIGHFNKDDFYITHQKLSRGNLVLYSVMSVSELEERYKLAVLILLGVLALMIPVLLFRVHQESLDRAKAADDLIDAFCALRQGDLKSKLVLDGSDFAIVAEAYNHMVNSLQQLMEQNEARAKANAVSEVRQLEAQFHPHFIFNTLENIKFMIKLDPAAAMKMIVALSSILRYGINNLIQEVPLAEDWKYTAEYLEIMQYRFGRRLSCELDMQVAMEEVWIPKLIFQPILENAIKYGEAEDGTISIKLGAYEKAGALFIRVSNGGLPITREQLRLMQGILQGEQNFSVHTGIYNVHRRLKLMYGEPYGLTITCPEGGGTMVELKLPLLKGDRKNAENRDS